MSVFVYVSAFFAPAVLKRPPNFVVVKYFLLGLLISNSIESILIIPKILDVLDQSAIQAKALEEMDIKRAEVKELVAEKQKEEKDLQRERERELKVLLKEKGKSTEKNGREDENESEEEGEEGEEEASHPRKHQGIKGQGGRKIHHSKGETGGAREKGHEPKSEAEVVSKEIRKRPQRLETGNNYVAVFMLFYGSSTLCLGVPAIFKESVRLLQALMVLSCVGTVILITSKFSLIMIMSVVKDAIIAALTFYYIMMIQQSTPAGDQTTGPVGALDPATAGTMPPQADVNAFVATDVAGVTVDYQQQQQQLQSNVQQVYNPTAVASGW